MIVYLTQLFRHSHAVHGVVYCRKKHQGVLTPFHNAMSIHVYSEINLHITWHTKGSLPLIRTSIEGALHQFIKNRVIQTPGAYFHAIGGIETHLHLSASVAPSINIDKWIGQLKGASSHEFGKAMQWQTGYGVVSFGSRDLQWVVNYIHNQREHHTKGTIADRLERVVEWEGR